MGEYIIIIIIITVILILVLTLTKQKTQESNYTNKSNIKTIKTEQTSRILEQIESELDHNKSTITSEKQEFAGKYQKRLLLTKNEYYEYKKLKEFAGKKGLQICPKVRLLDLIEPRKGDPKYKTLFYKIQAKHVDFVICDQNLYVKAILELDDNSHNQLDRLERDNFVDLILKDVGYTVIRTKSITEDTLNSI